MADDHPIRLTNTATRRKEPFVPLDWREGSGVPEADRRVRMYVCGPTVYDRAHLGNARSAVVFDVLFRLLRHVYGPERVTYVRNITDIDDKIIARAKETGRSVESITEETTRWYHEDMDALGVLRPTFEPRATDYLPQMIAMIRALIERGHAYEAQGHVLFSVSSYAAYGRLSGRSVEDMIAGARVEVAPYKRDPMDFVLWKPSAEGVPGWSSPWGRGRPGWHIECSAMARDLLGGQFDIHGGGLDLQFPHHENEIAQSRCAHPDEGFAQVWVHNEMLMVDGRKMSKSLGNFIYSKDVGVQFFDAEGISKPVPDVMPDGSTLRVASKYAARLYFFMTHYRKPMNWTAAGYEEAQVRLTKFRAASWKSRDMEPARPDPEAVRAITDDLNLPKALARLDELVDSAKYSELSTTMDLLGVYQFDFQQSELIQPDHLGDAKRRHFEDLDAVRNRWSHEIEVLLEARLKARKSHDFNSADTIRSSLIGAGVVIKDTPQGTEWELSSDFDPTKLEAIR